MADCTSRRSHRSASLSPGLSGLLPSTVSLRKYFAVRVLLATKSRWPNLCAENLTATSSIIWLTHLSQRSLPETRRKSASRPRSRFWLAGNGNTEACCGERCAPGMAFLLPLHEINNRGKLHGRDKSRWLSPNLCQV